MGTGFGLWSFVLAIALIAIDVVIYYPFVRVYDEQVLAEEKLNVDSEALNQVTMKERSRVEENVAVAPSFASETSVLVLCAGGGTSGLLANALNKAAKEYDAPVKAAAGSYGAHMDILKDFQLVILAPQVASNYEDIKQDTDRLGVKLVKTQGGEYIKLTRDGQGALAFVQGQFKN